MTLNHTLLGSLENVESTSKLAETTFSFCSDSHKLFATMQTRPSGMIFLWNSAEHYAKKLFGFT